MKTITENGAPLTVETVEKFDFLRNPFWQGRAIFESAAGRARVDVVTSALHRTAEEAEQAAVQLAREHGWF